jgi:hypothetical protein
MTLDYVRLISEIQTLLLIPATNISTTLFVPSVAQQKNSGLECVVLNVCTSNVIIHMCTLILLTSDSSHRPLSTQHTKTHSISGIRARDPINKVSANPCLRRHGHRVWNFSNNRSIYIRVIGIKFGFMSILGVSMYRMLVEVQGGLNMTGTICV